MKSLTRLLPYIYPYRYRLLSGFAGFFLARFFESWTYLLVAGGIDVIADHADDVDAMLDGVGAVAMGIVATVLARYVVVVHARREVRRVGFKVAFDLRQKLYATVQRQSGAFFERIGVGDLMTRAVQDISLLQRLVAFGSIQIVIMVFAPAFSVAVMSYTSPLLTLLILPLLPLIFVYGWHMAAAMATTSRNVQARLSDLGSHVQENLSGIRTIQAMAQEENEIRRFQDTNNAYAEAFYAQSRVNSLMSAWMPWFAAVAQLAIVLYGGNQVLNGAMSVGDLFVFFFFLNMLLQPIRMAGLFVTMVQRSAVSMDRLCEVFDAEPEIVDAPSGHAPMTIRGEFELRGLSWRYPRTQRDVLHDLHLHIRAGETIGIVGRIGAGKSTLLKLFTRMVNTPRGVLFLDGHDICDYPLGQLRMQVAQVLQDPFLFGEPLHTNISYDDPERGADIIWDSADAAALRSTIEMFPERLETLVGERGVTLSGGQKQRTTLARGLIRDAPVLILDDCFSSVDTATEEHILRRLETLRANRTTLLVSHRVSTLRHSDRIVVLDEGRIREVGSHEELLRLGGIYADLERVQTRGGRDIADDRQGRPMTWSPA